MANHKNEEKLMLFRRLENLHAYHGQPEEGSADYERFIAFTHDYDQFKQSAWYKRKRLREILLPATCMILLAGFAMTILIDLIF